MQVHTTTHFEIVMNDIQSDILEAAVSGNKLAIEDFIKSGKKLTKIIDAHGFTALHLAARAGHKEIAESLINVGIPVDIKSNDGFTPLHVAANSGQLSIVQLLLSKGANINAKSGNGLTPLHMATSGDQAHIVEFFLERGANINEKDSFGFTPLHISAYYGVEKTTDVLLASGADCAARNIKGETPAKVAINNDQHQVAGLFMKTLLEQMSRQQSQSRLLKTTEKFKERKKALGNYKEVASVRN